MLFPVLREIHHGCPYHLGKNVCSEKLDFRRPTICCENSALRDEVFNQTTMDFLIRECEYTCHALYRVSVDMNTQNEPALSGAGLLFSLIVEQV